MEKAKYYSRAPITEAVLGFLVKLPNSISVESLAKVQEGQNAQYPTRYNRKMLRAQVFGGEAVGTTASQAQVGYDFHSGDGKQIFQARLDGFAFSRLAPYDRWESFRDEGRRLWEIYRTVAQPEAITRIGVRYINRLDLPLQNLDFKHYLRTVPEVSPDLPQGLSGYFMQLQIPLEDLKATLVINQTLAPQPGPNMVSVLLDLDLFRDVEVPQEEEAIWRYLEKLKVRKNVVFEACITDQTRELIT
jgi:uncharacterized protein (TIGR04255 family)